jgi:hypothetical protein
MASSSRLPAACLRTALLGSLLAAAAAAQAASVGGGYHAMLTPGRAAAMGRTPPSEDQLAAGIELYYGGAVFSNVKVVSVIWGPNVNATTVATVPGFSAALVNSTYVDQLSEYDTFLHAVDGRHGTRQHIQRGTYLGQVQITPNNTSHNLADADVQAELRAQIKAGVLPPRDINTLYMVYFPTNVTITLDGLVSCQDFGAYHFAAIDTALSRKNLFYSVEPDCNSGIANITFAASHEFAEATTDNVPTPGSFPAFPQAWNTSDGFEIGDLCGGSGTLAAGSSRYTVTQVYLNSLGRCTTGNYTSP